MGNGALSSFGRYPETQSPLAAQGEPRLRFKSWKRAEYGERERHEKPLENIDAVIPDPQFFFPWRQKQNAQDRRTRDADHGKRDDKAGDVRQIIGKQSLVVMLASQKKRKPSQSENHERVRRPRVISLNGVERPIPALLFWNRFIFLESLKKVWHILRTPRPAALLLVNIF